MVQSNSNLKFFPPLLTSSCGFCVKVSKYRESLSFWRHKKKQKGSTWGQGPVKGMLKVLHFINTNISFILHRSLNYGTINFSRVRKLSEFKITGVYSRKAVQKKTNTQQFLIWLRSCIPYCLYCHPSRKFMSFRNYFSVNKTCSNKLWRNAEEGICREIFSWGQQWHSRK